MASLTKSKTTSKQTKNNNLKKYIVNISVLTSTIVLIIAEMYNEYMDKILKDLLAPLVSVDLDNNGEPDLKQLKQFKVKIGSAVFPFGNIIYNLIILSFKILILYFIVKLLIKNVRIPLSNK
jgi:large-conductance mechanosensitive channel